MGFEAMEEGGLMRTRLALTAALALFLAGCDKPAPKADVKPAAQPQPAAPVAQPAPELAAPAPAAKAPAAPDSDKELAARVKRALESESQILAAAFDVTASGGTVTLWGTASSADERTRAARAAYRVPGVTMVDNKLAVVKGS
jgi:hypothetical protein